MFNHSLIIGGTGMLKAANIEIARRSRRTISVARTGRSLDELEACLFPTSGEHHKLALDWNRPAEFLSGICTHLDAKGAPDLVLAWVHDGELALRLAESLFNAPCAFFHVIGSGGDHPLRRADAMAARMRGPAPLAYHQIMLGHMRCEAGRRWLTHQEISTGALEAMAKALPRYVIGTVNG